MGMSHGNGMEISNNLMVLAKLLGSDLQIFAMMGFFPVRVTGLFNAVPSHILSLPAFLPFKN